MEVKSLEGLRAAIEQFDPDWDQKNEEGEPRFSNKDVRKLKEWHKCDKDALVIKIDLILECQDKLVKYEDDVVEIMGRLKKVGFEYKEEEEPVPEPVVVPVPIVELEEEFPVPSLANPQEEKVEEKVEENPVTMDGSDGNWPIDGPISGNIPHSNSGDDNATVST